jgi:hypothetical protein
MFNRVAPYVERMVVTINVGSIREGPQRNRFLIYTKYLKSVRSGNWNALDFKAVYDIIDRTRLYPAVEEMQIPKKLTNLVRITMRNTQ